jgi:F0F1-type ATP synthase assembly protein I
MMIDQWFGTDPWATLPLLFLGVRVGLVKLHRAVSN